jgi:GTPase SAR1 family protein
LDSQEHRKGKKKKKSKHHKHKEKKSSMNILNNTFNFYEHEPYVALQMWDTAGKERFVSEATGLTSRLGDSFFRHANIAILVSVWSIFHSTDLLLDAITNLVTSFVFMAGL